MPADRSEKWGGGYVRRNKRGKPVYIIFQYINGKQYEISTRANSENAAHKHLARFQANPEGFDPRGDVRPDAIWLDETLSKAFLKHSKEEKENGAQWIGEQQRQLAWWAEQLNGVDLHRCSLRDHILPALEKAGSRKHAITSIKAFFSWLRKVRHQITLAEDPVAGGMLQCIQANKIKPKKKKAVSRAHVELAISHLAGGWRDALILQSESGWHVTEVRGFAQDGEIEPASDSQKAMGIAGVLVVQHKSREQHRTAVTQKVLEAAQRLRERGGFSVEWYMRAVASACKAAGITAFGPGKLRHSVATWLVDAGADLPTVATFLGHKSPSTTKKFYASFATPKNPGIVPPPRPPKEEEKAADKKSG